MLCDGIDEGVGFMPNQSHPMMRVKERVSEACAYRWDGLKNGFANLINGKGTVSEEEEKMAYKLFAFARLPMAFMLAVFLSPYITILCKQSAGADGKVAIPNPNLIPIPIPIPIP